MWCYRFEEACCYLLRAVSYDGDAGAKTEDIYGAMTDLCLLSTRCRPYSTLQRLIEDTRGFLARRGLERWGHRLDLIQAIGHWRRGEFGAAYQLSNRGWQRVQLTIDGPRYHNTSYLNCAIRAAHDMGDLEAMDAAIVLFHRHHEKSNQTSRIRNILCDAIRLAYSEFSEDSRETLDLMVQEIIGIMTATEWIRDETMDALRLLGMLGRWDEAAARLRQTGFAEGPDSSLLRLDLAVCKLGARSGWQVSFYAARIAESTPPLPLLTADEADHSRILNLLHEADARACAEDARMECSFYTSGVALRRQWLLGAATRGVGLASSTETSAA
ncbi:MAG: hypothetical protein EXS31_18250 [Pedosphaera sp.]|nr:hypothetical protein [Pedosphaera sp.]